jgi:alpha-glucosidase
VKVVKYLREIIDQYPERMLVGEIYTLPPGNTKTVSNYLGNGSNGLHMAFDFSLIFSRWDARRYYKIIIKMYKNIPSGSWPCHVLSNHDLYRSINRFRNTKDKEKKARILAVLLLTLKGTPFIYYGEEIGMENSKIGRNEIKDPLGKKFWPLFSGRDKARLPMQWNDQLNGGFSIGNPWLSPSKTYKTKNIDLQKNDPDSILSFHRKLISLRKQYVSLSKGEWAPLINGKKGILSYSRFNLDEKLIIIINFMANYQSIELPFKNASLTILFSSDKTIGGTSNEQILVEPYETTILKLNLS